MALVSRNSFVKIALAIKNFFECLHYLMLSEIAQGAYDLDNAR